MVYAVQLFRMGSWLWYKKKNKKIKKAFFVQGLPTKGLLSESCKCQ